MVKVAAGEGGGGPAWRLIPGQLLVHRSWQEETVLFNNLSGDTHLLGADALSLLLALRDAPLTSDELRQADDPDSLRALLDRLAGLGLVEQAQ